MEEDEKQLPTDTEPTSSENSTSGWAAEPEFVAAATPSFAAPQKEEKKEPMWKQLGYKKPGPRPGTPSKRWPAKTAKDFGGNPTTTDAKVDVRYVAVPTTVHPFNAPSGKLSASALKQMARIYNKAALELTSPKWTNNEGRVSRDTVAFVVSMRDAYIAEIQRDEPSYQYSEND